MAIKKEKTDYYELLGVDRNVNEDDLKKAYRKAAMRWHPDRNPGDKNAEEKFKELSEAYKVLSDGEKRARYDRFGHDAFGHPDFDIEVIFKHVQAMLRQYEEIMRQQAARQQQHQTAEETRGDRKGRGPFIRVYTVRNGRIFEENGTETEFEDLDLFRQGPHGFHPFGFGGDFRRAAQPAVHPLKDEYFTKTVRPKMKGTGAILALSGCVAWLNMMNGPSDVPLFHSVVTSISTTLAYLAATDYATKKADEIVQGITVDRMPHYSEKPSKGSLAKAWAAVALATTLAAGGAWWLTHETVDYFFGDDQPKQAEKVEIQQTKPFIPAAARL